METALKDRNGRSHKSRSRSRSFSRTRLRTRSETRSRSGSRSHMKVELKSEAKYRSRSRSHLKNEPKLERSRSRTRSRSRSRSHLKVEPKLEHSRSRTRSRSRSHLKVEPKSEPYRSRSKSRLRSRSGSYRHKSSRSRRNRSRTRSRTRTRSPSRRRYRTRSRSPVPYRCRYADRDNPPAGRCIGVFNLSRRITAREIDEIFREYGPVEKVQIVYDAKSGMSKGYCFIYYEHVEDAKLARKKTNGMDIDGKAIRVDFSITQRPHTPTPGIYMGKPPYGRRREYRGRSRSRSSRRRSRRSRTRSRSRRRTRSPTRSYSRSRSRSRHTIMSPPIGSPLGPPPPPPPLPSLSLPKVTDRSELLNSIRKGAKLKKAITNDKSAPNINFASQNGFQPKSSVTNGSKKESCLPVAKNGILNLGDILAAGRPKLRPTGRNIAEIDRPKDQQNVQINRNVDGNFQKLVPFDTKNRSAPTETSQHQNNSHKDISIENCQKANTINLTLNRLKSADVSKPVPPPPPPPILSHGKPNIAPKPPSLTLKPATATPTITAHPLISRAQSMREPRSPTTATTTTKIFSNGTIRGFPSGYLPSSCTSQSTNNLKHLPSMRQGTRPPPPPLPTRIGPSSIIKPPVDPPPPPPSTLRSLPLVTSTNESTNNSTINTISNSHTNNMSAPPPPPTRLSSIRTDLEAKFGKQFRAISEFPKPPKYQNIPKKYFSRSVPISSKQPAPLPPNQLVNTNKSTAATTNLELTT